MISIKQLIKEVMDDINNKLLVYVKVGPDITSNKQYFTEILSTISEFTNKAKGKMENARRITLAGKGEWIYVVSFPDENKRKRFMDEMLKKHPELEVKIPETK